MDQSWRRNIQSKIKGTPEKKCLIYKSLRVMHQEPNEIIFTELLNGFMTEIMNDDDTIQFGEYFNSYYINKLNSGHTVTEETVVLIQICIWSQCISA